MRVFFVFIALIYTICGFSQISGKVVDETETPIANATVYINNTVNTLTNIHGEFKLPNVSKGNYTLYIQSKYHNNLVKNLQVENSTFSLYFQLHSRKKESNLHFDREDTKQLIKNAIKSRKLNQEKTGTYSTNYYSNSNIQIINYPKRFFGYDIQQLDPSLKIDSLRKKQIFNAEVFSNVQVQAPYKFKETIVAEKKNGEVQGLMFHTAYVSNFDFYSNEAYPTWKLISPLSKNAFLYYTYEIEEIYTDELSKKEIYKISVKPLRENEPVVNGYIHLVKNSYEIFAVDFSVKGKQIQNPSIDLFFIQQQYVYDATYDTFIKKNQQLTFSGKILVFEYRSEYLSLYNHTNLLPNFDKKTFNNELIHYQNNFKKNNTFWETNRPVMLTDLESDNRTAQDQQTWLTNTKQYQDSIDKVNNRFNPIKLIIGYKFRNSYKNETLKYNGLLSTFAFNAVQGFNVTTGLSYLKEFPQKETYYEIGGLVNYGLAENKPRFSGYYSQLFNRKDYAKLDITGGVVVHQFGEEYPIKKIINSLASSYFGKNFAKFYKKEFIRAVYEQEIFNGFFGKVDFEYANRLPLFNNTEFSPFVKDKPFLSNNPLDPTDFTSSGFESNHIFKLRLKATYHIGQKYITYPNKKINFRNSKYPSLTLTYENGFGSTKTNNNYELIGLSTKYQTSLGVIGNWGLYINTGKFINADNISFMDYKHFYGNETFVGTSANYLERFNLLPYYEMSTNQDYIEWHMEHYFKGFILNKVPLLNKLQYQLVIGAHGLQTKTKKAYHEFSVGLDNFGFGKFRPFRIDYFQSFHGGTTANGIVIGIKLLDKMN